MARRPPKNLLEATYLSARANGLSPLKAINYGGEAITLAAALAVVHYLGVGQDGRFPTQLEYAEHYGMTDRNAQREWQRYRQVFGEHARPEDLARSLLAEVPGAIARLAELRKPEEVLDIAVRTPASVLGMPALA